MRQLGVLAVTAALLLAGESAALAGQAPSACPAADTAGAPLLHIRGEVQQPLDVTADDLARLPRRQVRVSEHEGEQPVEYGGVRVADALAHAGLPIESLRGRQTALVVVAEARDGYRAAFALGELDEAFSDRLVLLADRRDGAALSAEEGPFRIVMEGERRHSRWIRQVSCLRVVRP